MQNLPNEWEVPQSFRSRIGSTIGRQRVMFKDGHLLLILHAPPKLGQQERSGRFFWRSPQGQWKSAQTGDVTMTLEQHVNEYDAALDACERADEGATTSKEYFDVLESLAPLQRATGHMYQVLQEARKLVNDDLDIINMRDRSYELTRTADLLVTSAKNELDCTVARQAEKLATESHKMAVSAHRLNLLVAFFFPIATLAAVFSTEFRSGLVGFFSPPLPLIVMLLTGLLFGILLSLYVIRK